METIKIILCPACTGCPAVEITDQGVTIGEDDLVARVRRGELREV
jgi:hypothetical protein